MIVAPADLRAGRDMIQQGPRFGGAFAYGAHAGQ